MSASREKKQRQGAGPDQRAVRAQQEQAARKRTTIIYSVIAAVIAVLVIALLVWRSGFFQSRAAAATIGDETLTTAELSFYYYDARRSVASLAAYGLNTFDTSKADDEQFYNEAEGQTYRDYFMETALTNAQQHKAMAEEAVKAGHTEDEVKESVNAYIDSVKAQAASSGYSYSAYLRALFGPYMKADILEKFYTRFEMAHLLSNDKYDELFDGYTQADLEEYYKAEGNADGLDTIEYSYLYFAIPTVNTKDEEGNDLSDEALQELKNQVQTEAKENAEAALEAVEDGASFDSQADEYKLAAGSRGDHVKVIGISGINSSYRDHLLHLDEGECELVETDSGYYVISLHGRYLDDEPTRDVRHLVVLAESTTDDEDNAVAPTDEAWAAAKEKMDAIQAEWDASGKTEDDFIALSEKNSGDNISGGLIERVASTNTKLVPEFREWLFEDHQPGDSGVIQHSAADTDSNKYWGYHLMFYVGENEPVWMNTARDSKATEDQQAWMEEMGDTCPAALTSGADYVGK